MARAQYQYQSLVGPVWLASVAASLAWLPAGCAQPVRALSPNRLPEHVVQPFVEAVDTARQLRWAYYGPQPLPAERRNIIGSVAPSSSVLYRPEGLQWLPTDRQRVPVLPRGIQTWGLLDPFPRPPAYDPAGLQWTPAIRQPSRELVRYRLGSGVLDPLPIPPPGVRLVVEPDDLGAFRYGVVDESQVSIRYVVVDCSDVRYLVVDAGSIRYLLRDDGAHRYGITEDGVD